MRTGKGISRRIVYLTQTIPLAHADFTSYFSSHIRPLEVGPLDYHERVPKPWGFFVFAQAGCFRTTGRGA
jgi:hypothetical protein